MGLMSYVFQIAKIITLSVFPESMKALFEAEEEGTEIGTGYT